jgi:hypothetical protein
MIRRLLFSYLIAVAGPVGLMAADKQAAQDLLKTAAQQASLLDNSSRPFVMDVDFTAKFDGPMQGHLRLRWEAKDRWWSKVTMGPFEQVLFMNGDKSYTLRNLDFTPLQVRDLMSLLHVGKDVDKLVAKKDKQRVEGSLSADCIEAERSDAGSQHEEVCVDAGTHWILTRTLTNPLYVQTSRYSDFAEFGGHAYPRRLQLDKNGETVITANVMKLEEEALDPNLLVPPVGAIERRACANPTPPKALTQPEADFTSLRLPNGATSIVAATVHIDGSVGGVQLIKSGGQAMDQAWMNAVKKYTFKPAMCGTDPVEYEVTLQTNFRRY